jgi:hypothetical protein
VPAHRVEVTTEADELVVRAERSLPFAAPQSALRRLEIPYGYFSFTAEDGAAHEVRSPLASLEALGAEHGSTVPIVYQRSNPAAIRPAMPMGALLRALSFLTAGVAILFAVLTVRWIASQRGGIEIDVQRLHDAHSTQARGSLRLPVAAVAKKSPAAGMNQRRR